MSANAPGNKRFPGRESVLERSLGLELFSCDQSRCKSIRGWEHSSQTAFQIYYKVLPRAATSRWGSLRLCIVRLPNSEFAVASMHVTPSRQSSLKLTTSAPYDTSSPSASDPVIQYICMKKTGCRYSGLHRPGYTVPRHDEVMVSRLTRKRSRWRSARRELSVYQFSDTEKDATQALHCRFGIGADVVRVLFPCSLDVIALLEMS